MYLESQSVFQFRIEGVLILPPTWETLDLWLWVHLNSPESLIRVACIRLRFQQTNQSNGNDCNLASWDVIATTHALSTHSPSSVRCNQGSDRVQTDHDQQTHRKISEISCGSGDLLLNTYVQAAKCVPSLVYTNPCYSNKQCRCNKRESQLHWYASLLY